MYEIDVFERYMYKFIFFFICIYVYYFKYIVYIKCLIRYLLINVYSIIIRICEDLKLEKGIWGVFFFLFGNLNIFNLW